MRGAAAEARRQVGRSFGQFWRARGGGLGVLTTVMAPLLMIVTGVAVDYGRAITTRQTLQHAADAAALALANAQVLKAPRPDSDAREIILANLDRAPATLLDVEVDQRDDGFARVVASVDQGNFFLGFAGLDDWEIAVVSEARFDNPPDIDIMVLLDNSPSMLIGATLDDMDGIGDVSRTLGEGNCAFACHYAGRDTYTAIRGMGLDTRLDAAKSAIEDAIDIAIDNSKASQAQVYFDLKSFTSGYSSVADGEASALKAAGSVASIEPIDQPSSNIYEQSDQQFALGRAATDYTARRAAHGDRVPFFVLVTDGVMDARRSGRTIAPIDPAWCAAIKNQGVELAVIYTTYFEIPSNGFWRANVQPFTNRIGPNLQACASPGWFFEARYGEDIHEAFEEIMALALPKPRLTQ